MCNFLPEVLKFPPGRRLTNYSGFHKRVEPNFNLKLYLSGEINLIMIILFLSNLYEVIFSWFPHKSFSSVTEGPRPQKNIFFPFGLLILILYCFSTYFRCLFQNWKYFTKKLIAMCTALWIKYILFFLYVWFFIIFKSTSFKFLHGVHHHQGKWQHKIWQQSKHKLFYLIFFKSSVFLLWNNVE